MGRRTLKSVGVKIGNNRLLAFAKYLISNDIKIWFAVPGGSQEIKQLSPNDSCFFFYIFAITALFRGQCKYRVNVNMGSM